MATLSVDCELRGVFPQHRMHRRAKLLDSRLSSLLTRQRGSVSQLLLHCMRDVVPDVRQSAFALVGDLAKVRAALSSPALVCACAHASPSRGQLRIPS